MSENTLTFYNNPDLKAQRIANAIRHRDSDMLVSGVYNDKNGHGCSVGCDAIDLDYTGDTPHAIVANKWGTPLWLEHLRDCVFEGLPPDARAEWHVNLARAIPIGANLDCMYHQFLAWLLSNESPCSAENADTQVAAAVSAVRELHLRAIAGEAVTPEEWAAAAYSAARSAAHSAADSAAYAARSAYAAYSAAYAAADSAAYAARSADSAAYFAFAAKLLELLGKA